MKGASKLRDLLRILGPGFITGAADDDPSGIATYSQTGAQFGYSQLWTMPFSFPFMVAMQEMCGRIGMVTGEGLAGVLKKHYSRKVLAAGIFLLLLANAINIGADLGAMAASAQLLVGGSFSAWVVGMTFFTLVLEIFVSYHLYARVLKYFTLSLLAYAITFLMVKQPWGQILAATVIPHISFSRDYLLNVVAIIGTTISPYLFFWQANEEVEEAIDLHKPKVLARRSPRIVVQDLQRMRHDTMAGMFFSNVIAFFIMATAASTLGVHGITDVQTADQAAEALRPLAGEYAFILFAVGIVGTGLLAVPVLAGSASYAIAEAAGWNAGLYKRLRQAHGFYGVITLATVLGVIVNFVGIPPFKMLYYSAVLNGITAPPLMIFILLIANNEQIMGKQRNGLLGNLFGWTITAIMALAAIALVVSAFLP